MFFRFRYFLDLDLLCSLSGGCVVKSCACQLYIKRIYDDDDDDEPDGKRRTPVTDCSPAAEVKS